MRSLPLIIFVLALLTSCKVDQPQPYANISGKTMGTTYNIIVDSNPNIDLKKEIDRLLVEINQAVSTYEKESIISLFNRDYDRYLNQPTDSIYTYFLENFELSKEINELTYGAFEPTVMPVVNYWGFGYTGKNKVSTVDTNQIALLMKEVGFKHLYLEDGVVKKTRDSTELDFSGVAKGYAVDKIAEFLQSKGISNHYVEIGGEVYANGVNDKGVKWRTGISIPSPVSSQDDFQQILEISGQGIATSGNYRNFYESEGGIYSHTINPLTGFPERTNLLSATIIAPSCAIADGYATACMVLGLDKSIELVNLQEEIEGIFIFADENEEVQVYDSTKK